MFKDSDSGEEAMEAVPLVCCVLPLSVVVLAGIALLVHFL